MYFIYKVELVKRGKKLKVNDAFEAHLILQELGIVRLFYKTLGFVISQLHAVLKFKELI